MNTKVIKLDINTTHENAIHEAADCLKNGGLVVFPTETVYGLGANSTNPAAIDRLREVKQRSTEKPFTTHIGSRKAVEQFVPHLEGIGRRLTEKAWPGPLTLIFQVQDAEEAPVIKKSSTEHIKAMYHKGTIGIRCPVDPVAANLLTEAEIPVVAASANPAGAEAPVEADEILDTLGGQVDLVLDAGRTRYAKPSTIVQVNSSTYTILREGVLDERTIRRLSTLNFLMVCSGNTCRSPMAEGLLRRLLAEKIGCNDHDLEKYGYFVESAGTSALGNVPASAPAVKAMKRRGIDISGHYSQPLGLEQINRSDYIFTMTAYHLEAVTSLDSTAVERSRRIDDSDIDDPIGGNDEVYERCAQRLERALHRRLEEIKL